MCVSSFFRPNKQKRLVLENLMPASMKDREGPDCLKHLYLCFQAVQGQLSRNGWLLAVASILGPNKQKRLVFENLMPGTPDCLKHMCFQAFYGGRNHAHLATLGAPVLRITPHRFEKSLFRKPPRNSGFGARLRPVSSL